MRTRELRRIKYVEDMADNARFACRRYYDGTCPHYDDTCMCPRFDLAPIVGQKPEDRDKSKDDCPDFKKASAKLYHEALCWEREELMELFSLLG